MWLISEQWQLVRCRDRFGKIVNNGGRPVVLTNTTL